MSWITFLAYNKPDIIQEGGMFIFQVYHVFISLYNNLFLISATVI